MAVLKHEASGRRVTLAARSLVGRAEGCGVRLRSSLASGEHAVLFWDGARWSVRDLGSRNGTLAGDRKLGLAERLVLEVGAVVAFGGEAERWILEDAGAPVACARNLDTGSVRVAEDGLLVLPTGGDPRVTMSQDRDGVWQIELDDAARPAVDQERVEAAGVWLISIPPAAQGGALPTTATAGARAKLVGTTVLRFEVSRDEEFVALSLVHGGEVTSLGARAHHELLLSLARARLRDMTVGAALPPAEQGWLYVDDLLSMLRLDLHHFNVNVFRARQQLASAGMLDVGALVERRSTTRQIRLGTTAVEVVQP